MVSTEHAIWWHVYPLGFTGAPQRAADAEPGVVHRLSHLVNWLDYAVELGASGLQLGPIFASTSHGYDTLDYDRIDPRLGDEDDFAALVAACHERGLAVMLDGVFNHVSREHAQFAQALREGPDSTAGHLFRIDWSGDEPQPAVFEGHGDLVALNHDDPATVDLVVGVMERWLDRGVDAWRLDAAYAVPTPFWRQVSDRVRASHPGALLLGEVLHGDYAAFVSESGLDTVTQYELWKALWSSINDTNFYELAHALERHTIFCDTFVPTTFVGNHDVTRIASKIGDAGAALATVALFTLPGMPVVYYGDEQAYHGEKFEDWGGDDQVRPLFPARPEELSELGRWMYRLHQDLIGLRRRHPWLVRGRVEVTELANERIAYTVRANEGALQVVLDLTGQPRAQVSRDGEVLLAWS